MPTSSPASRRIAGRAFEQCWRKDWQDTEPHLLPAKHLVAWIQNNLYLALADAPFDLEDSTLNPTAGACLTCPRRSGYNTSLFPDVAGDQCLQGNCYQMKVSAHLDRAIAARPELMQIENGWRSAREQAGSCPARPLPRNRSGRGEPGCRASPALRSRQDGHHRLWQWRRHRPFHLHRRQLPHTRSTCSGRTGRGPCSTMNPRPKPRRKRKPRSARPIPTTAQGIREGTGAEGEKPGRRRNGAKECEAERARREKLQKARLARFDRILDKAPVTFSAKQLKVFLHALVNLDPYSFTTT